MKFAVIGGGVIGVCTAYYLARAGHEVTLFEQQNDVGLGTSFANASLLTPGLCEPWVSSSKVWSVMKVQFSQHRAIRLSLRDFPEFAWWGLRTLPHFGGRSFAKRAEASGALARLSVQLIDRLAAELGLSFNYQTRGVMEIIRNAATFRHLNTSSSRTTLCGGTYELLNQQQTIDLEPALASIAEDIHGSIYYSADANGDARVFCQAMAKVCADLNVGLKTNTVIKRLVLERGRLNGVETQQGEERFDACVVAAGNTSRSLLKGIGLDLPQYPVKGYSITVPMGTDAGGAPRIPVLDPAKQTAIAPLGDQLRITGFAEFAGYDTTVSPGRVQMLNDVLSQTFPVLGALAGADDRHAWAGLRPQSADGIPLVGECGTIPGLYLNTGHGSYGWTMAAGSGYLLSGAINGGRADINFESFSPQRFGL